MTSDDLKRQAAAQAAGLVRPGMRLGLGTGSTAAHFVRLLGERIEGEGLVVRGVATSEATAELARACGVPLSTLDDTPELDLAVDGADEIDPDLKLIKGGGGALLREKIVASAADQFIVIADSGKLVDTLGRFPLPVEVIPFGHRASVLEIAGLAPHFGADGDIRQRLEADGAPFATDNGNFVYDCAFGTIADPEGLAMALSSVAGVVEHGLFIDLCVAAIVAGPDGVEMIWVEDED